MPYHILSLDGGGIRGIYSARVLERLEQILPGTTSRIDLFAGTSTGGILALGLASGMSAVDLVSLYRDHAREIFHDSWWDNIQDLGGLTAAEYDNTNLKQILTRIFGQMKLRDLARRVLVPCFDLDNCDDPLKEKAEPRMWKAKFFHNYPGEDSDGDESIVDVALRTSAAPTYFPTYQGYIDGGVVANNPAVAALAQALDPDTGGQSLSDLRLLSIGTGQSPQFVAGQKLDWGYAQWAKPLINLMIDGVMGVSEYQCRRILKKNYRRINTQLETAIKLDDVKCIPQLLSIADAVDLKDVVTWLGT